MRHEPDWRLADDTAWTVYDLPDESASAASLSSAASACASAASTCSSTPTAGTGSASYPNGEWGWLQVAGLPIADVLAAELAG